MTFIVVTREHVEGRYEVEADTEAEARAKFESDKWRINWTGVEQVSYEAYDVEVESVVESCA